MTDKNLSERFSNSDSTYVNITNQDIQKDFFSQLNYAFQDPIHAKKCCSQEECVWKVNIPILGRVRILKDLVGLFAETSITLYWVFNYYIHVFYLLLPAYSNGYGSLWMIIWYVAVGLLTLVSLVRTSTMNPGELNNNSTQKENWTLCQKCNKMRPPHTHHCRRCGQCVRVMDHHCPWLNNCVGEDNRYVFILVVAYAIMMAVITCTLDVLVVKSYTPCFHCSDTVMFIQVINHIKFSFLSSLLLTIGGVGLLISQHLSIIFQIPTMEMARLQLEMIITRKMPEKMPEPRESFLEGYAEVFGEDSKVCWFNPCRNRKIRLKQDGLFV